MKLVKNVFYDLNQAELETVYDCQQIIGNILDALESQYVDDSFLENLEECRTTLQQVQDLEGVGITEEIIKE